MMDVKVLLLVNFAIFVNGQSTISSRNDATNEDGQCENMKTEMESIRQLLMNLERALPSIGLPVIQEMKSEIENIKSTMGSIRQLVTFQRQTAVRNETLSMQHLWSEMQDIRKIVIRQQYWSRNEQIKSECPFGFDYLPEAGTCFRFIFEEMTWDNATERCRAIMPGVHLATITSQEENDAIARYLLSKYSENNVASRQQLVENPHDYAVWIGGYRERPGRCDDFFIWKPLIGIEIPFNYTNWANDEPNCDGDEPCVHIVPGMDFAWNDSGCSRLNFPLCEI